MQRSELNEVYSKVDGKAREIAKILCCPFGYYNGHYYKNASGNFEMDYFPIPVVTLKGLCDIEVGLEQISVTTKLSKEKALSYDFAKVKDFSFEAYGVENYLDDFYVEGDTIDEMKAKIQKSNEQNVFFSFYFPFDVASNEVCELVTLISQEGFFY